MLDKDCESSCQRVGESSLSHATSAAEVGYWQHYMTKRPLPTYAERS